jgi:uncharacterized damage-inducible protein DinB
MSRLQLAIEQITFARNYTIRLLDQMPISEWYSMPPGGVTHVAWQVGHLTIAEYRLCLHRIRGEKPEDAELVPEEFQRAFKRKSMPDADPAKYPNQAALRANFDRVHAQVLRELAELDEAELDNPALLEHPLTKTKLQSLQWCALHEAVHAGQIGLLRRQLDHPPLW